MANLHGSCREIFDVDELEGPKCDSCIESEIERRLEIALASGDYGVIDGD